VRNSSLRTSTGFSDFARKGRPARMDKEVSDDGEFRWEELSDVYRVIKLLKGENPDETKNITKFDMKKEIMDFARRIVEKFGRP